MFSSLLLPSLVPVLRGRICPPEISGFVIAVIVYPIYRKTVWALPEMFSNIISKCNVTFNPRLVYRDSTRSIVIKCLGLRIKTALFDINPRPVERGSTTSVGRGRLYGRGAQPLSMQAAARLGFSEQASQPHRLHVSAITKAKKSSYGIVAVNQRLCFSDYRQPTKFGAGRDFDPIMTRNVCGLHDFFMATPATYHVAGPQMRQPNVFDGSAFALAQESANFSPAGHCGFGLTDDSQLTEYCAGPDVKSFPHISMLMDRTF